MAEKPAKPIAAIELLKPHTHAGRDYPVGAKLDLAQIGMDQDSAAWLVGIGSAKVTDPVQ